MLSRADVKCLLRKEKHLSESEEEHRDKISFPGTQAKPACKPVSADVEGRMLIRPREDMMEKSGISGAALTPVPGTNPPESESSGLLGMAS